MTADFDADFRVTISQLPAGGSEPARDWDRLVDHVTREGSDLVVLPEMPFDDWLPATDDVDPDAWDAAVRAHDESLDRFDDLAPAAVAGSRPVTREGTRLNEGFVWDTEQGYRAVHHKARLPDEAGFWEASWYDPGPEDFSPVTVAGVSVGFLICTELWAMEQARAYGRDGVHLLVTPRATEAATSEKWLAAGRTAAVVAGAFSVSANRSKVDDGPDFAGESWCFGPDGERLGLTSDDEPFVTVVIDPADAERAQETYPRYALK
jgi:N-carbamoylputrescine amidase